MLPKDLGEIFQYIVEKFTDIFYSALNVTTLFDEVGE